jgi:hypothetical protein
MSRGGNCHPLDMGTQTIMVVASEQYVKSFGAASLARRAHFGNAGEILTVELLREFLPAHYDVKKVNVNGYDVRITDKLTGQITRVEVKSARQANDGKYRATLYKRGHCNAGKHSDLIVFWVVTPTSGGVAYPFFIPTHFVQHKTFLCVTSDPTKYAGELSRYRSDFSYVLEVLK